MPARSTTYFSLACVIAGVGVVALIGAAGYYWWALSVADGQGLSRASEDWGTFGDFVSGIAGTAIAMCTLVALAITLHLQAKELEATRRELGKQTEAAHRQLEYEARRLRPFLKTEWFQDEHAGKLEWRITNVGLGPCIIDHVELRKSNDDALGGFHASADPDAIKTWHFAFSSSWNDDAYDYQPKVITVTPLNNFNRVLGPNEHQRTLTLLFEGKGQRNRAFKRLQMDDWVRPIVQYRSIDGKSFTTLTQLETFDEQEGPAGAVVSLRDFPYLGEGATT
jgi:hypothetical protein